MLEPGGARLVRPEVAESKMAYAPAPAGLVAVFADGHEPSVLYYDVHVHGRAVLMAEDDVTCDLVLAESTNDVVRVE